MASRDGTMGSRVTWRARCPHCVRRRRRDGGADVVSVYLGNPGGAANEGTTVRLGDGQNKTFISGVKRGRLRERQPACSRPSPSLSSIPVRREARNADGTWGETA